MLARSGAEPKRVVLSHQAQLGLVLSVGEGRDESQETHSSTSTVSTGRLLWGGSCTLDDCVCGGFPYNGDASRYNHSIRTAAWTRRPPP